MNNHKKMQILIRCPECDGYQHIDIERDFDVMPEDFDILMPNLIGVKTCAECGMYYAVRLGTKTQGNKVMAEAVTYNMIIKGITYSMMPK